MGYVHNNPTDGLIRNLSSLNFIVGEMSEWGIL